MVPLYFLNHIVRARVPGHTPETLPRGGIDAGTFLHELLEHCAEEGFAHAAVPSPALCDTIARRCQARGWQGWIRPLTEWLPVLLRTPLALLHVQQPRQRHAPRRKPNPRPRLLKKPAAPRIWMNAAARPWPRRKPSAP